MAEKLILLKLADNANDNGFCWPSVERMAKECHMDVRTAQRLIRALEAKKWLVTKFRSGHSSTYQLQLPDPRHSATPGGTPPPAQDHPSPGGTPPPPPAVRHPEPSGEPSKNHQVHPHPSFEEVRLTFQKTGLPDSDAEWFFNKCEGNGWTNGGRAIKSWPHTVASWKAAGYMPSQKIQKRQENVI